MTVTLIVLGSLLAVWVLLNLKTSRPDGTLVRGLHPYRKMMSYIMPTRNESVVYFDSFVRAEKLLDYLAQVSRRFEVDITHCVVAACAVGLRENPKMNQFVAGHRLYARKGRWVTFSMKRKRMDKKAKLAAVKLEMTEGETFAELCARINGQVQVERSDAVTYTDQEVGILSKVPRPVMNLLVRLLRWLDYHNVLPGAFIKNDAMYTSMFVANLGSLKMGAGYHHLYEWGTCPLFLMVGQLEDRPVVEDGQIRVRKILHLRFTYDERIDDGLTARDGIQSLVDVLEDPFQRLGCLDETGRDAHPIGEGREAA